MIDEQERLCGIVSLGDLSREGDTDNAAEALEGFAQLWADSICSN